jgi:hypothetical protein
MIDDNDEVPFKPTQVAAKRDFYWYKKLEVYGLQLDDVWWNVSFVERRKDKNSAKSLE